MRKNLRKFFTTLFSLFSALYEHIRASYVLNSQLGGYVHDTAMSQYIPPTTFHIVTGTWTQAAGQVAGTICMHKAAAAESPVVNVPIMIPSNSVGLKGAYLKSVELDYEVQVADLTSITLSINKVVRGTDTNVAVVSAPAVTQDVAAASAKTVEQHKVVVTLTTPAWISNTEYYLLKAALVAPATTTVDLLGAVANFTERI
jgi:hypothetical protein